MDIQNYKLQFLNGEEVIQEITLLPEEIDGNVNYFNLNNTNLNQSNPVAELHLRVLTKEAMEQFHELPLETLSNNLNVNFYANDVLIFSINPDSNMTILYNEVLAQQVYGLFQIIKGE